MNRLAFFVAVAVGWLAPLTLRAQGVEYVKAHYTKGEYQVPMRDGARLFTTVFAPRDTTQTYPLLMVRTQSGARPYGPDEYPPTLIGPSSLPHFVKEGYIFVVQDVRGRWMSEGTFVNMRPHHPDKRTSRDIDESSDVYDTDRKSVV